ncbi:MAG: hypothetical protein U5L45_23950 [Saprospiraceae bacterium]|nr:hypothetical protein [Saprospiraceae bacterium]
MRSLRSLKRRRGCSFFGLCPKNEQPLLLLSERSERENQQFGFYVWFQKAITKKLNLFSLPCKNKVNKVFLKRFWKSRKNLLLKSGEIITFVPT